MHNYSFFKSHPLRVPASVRHATIKEFLEAETFWTKGVEDIAPAAGAFMHYGGVELADKLFILNPSASPQELTDLSHMWEESCGIVCRHLLFYVWRIISKEQRHANTSKAHKAFGQNFTPAQKAVADLCAHGEDWEMTMHANSGVLVGDYVDAIEKHYRSGGWAGSYGGKKWANIALELQRYINGETSAMIAGDRCWTLVHNTGSIFNKGFYFLGHDMYLPQVLDKQASGSVFELSINYQSQLEYRFQEFVELAVTLIRRAEPEYNPYEHPIPVPVEPKQQTNGRITKNIGSLVLHSTADRGEN